jgi:sphingolipid C9-methyltransferase
VEALVAELSDFVAIHDRKLAARYANEKMPMTTLFEAYLDGAVDIHDVDKFLDARHELVKFTLTEDHVKFFFTNFIPEVAIHSKKQDERIVREHYDRGNDFFEYFLGDRMVYTSGFFLNGKETLEQAQDQKIDLVCQKLMVKPGEKLLDIGCGWGTLARRAAQKFGVDATGVTISKNQTELANERIKAAGVENARVLCLDYRDIPKKKFDKISCLEMVEHVGVKNLGKFFGQIYDLLADDGLFLIQWVGIRRGAGEGVPVIGLRPEDLVWGLFMNKYIFPGADASLPLSDLSKSMEKAGFDIQSVENISVHYCYTLKMWHQNWKSNREAILKTYGERWYRLWDLFLPWAALIGLQGSAACYQLVASKNINAYDRAKFVGHHLGRPIASAANGAQMPAAAQATAAAE